MTKNEIKKEVFELIQEQKSIKLNDQEKIKAINRFTNNDEINKYQFLFYLLYFSFFVLTIYVTFLNEESTFFLKLAINGLFMFSAFNMFFQIKAVNYLKTKKDEVVKSGNYIIEKIYPFYLENIGKIKKDLTNNTWLFLTALFLTYMALFFDVFKT